jgi:hypothetical protein
MKKLLLVALVVLAGCEDYDENDKPCGRERLVEGKTARMEFLKIDVLVIQNPKVKNLDSNCLVQVRQWNGTITHFDIRELTQ